MAATDCSKTPRSKSIKARALTLRDYEARKLAQDGRVLIVREVRPQPPSEQKIRELSGGGYSIYCYDSDKVVSNRWSLAGPIWAFRELGFQIQSWRCPLGPVGSPLVGKETWGLPSYDVDGDGECWGVDDWEGPTPKSKPPFHHPVYAADGNFSHESVEDRGFIWRSGLVMPDWASRFPRLRHESCEVKRAESLTWDELASMGLPDGPDRIVKPGSSPIEYIEIKPDDMVAQLHGTPAGRWAWCSLVVDLDRLEVADA